MTAATGTRRWPFGTVALAALLAALLAMDVASLTWAAAGRVGVVLWWLSWLVLGVHAARCLGSLVRDVLTHGRGIATLLVLLALTATVLVATFDTRVLHHETTQEIACALKCLGTSPSWGYTDTCLFGYPARQFLVPAVPSLLFGRSYTALTLGGALYFIVAVSIFAGGLRSHLERGLEGDLLTALVLSFLPHIHYFNHFMYAFEESVYPFLFGLILCGLALQWMKAQTLSYPLMIGLVLLHLIWGYTTALALFSLGLVLLCTHALASKSQSRSGRAVSLGVAAIAAASFLVSLQERTDLRAFGERSPAELVDDVGSAFRHIFLVPIDPANAFVTRFLLVFMVVALIGSIVFLDRWRGVVLGGWMWGVLVVSVILEGYSYYDITLRVHKAMVVFPVMFCMLVFLWQRLAPNPKLAKPGLLVLLGVSLFVGGRAQYASVWTRPPEWRISLIRFLEQALPDAGRSRDRLLLVEAPGSFRPWENLNDFMQYFLPRLQTRGNAVNSSTCDAVRRKVERATADREVLLVVPAGTSTSQCFSGSRLEPLGVFRFGDDEPLVLTRLVGTPGAVAARGWEVRVADLHPTTVEYGFAAPQIDEGWEGGPLRTGGVEYVTGIGMHAWCRMTYEVPPNAASFESVVGLADSAQSCAAADVVFQLLDQNGLVLYDSGLVRPGDPALHLHVGLAGATRVTLAVGEGKNGRDCDHAVWGDPVFSLQGAPAPSR